MSIQRYVEQLLADIAYATENVEEPYHLDPKYDDENGNPHDYGFGRHEDDDPADYWKQ